MTVKPAFLLFIITMIMFTVSRSSLGSTDTTANDAYTPSETTIVVKQSDPYFNLALPANPTTGYVWLLSDYDDNFIVPVSHSFASGKSGLMGASGVDHWRFNVKSTAFSVPHHMTMLMMYARPWEVEHAVKKVTFQISTSP